MDGALDLSIVFSEFRKVTSFDALQAIVLWLGWADKIRRCDFWNDLCDLYRKMLPEFILNEDIPFRFEIFDAIDAVALKYDLHVKNTGPCLKQSWKDEIPNFKLLLIEHYSTALNLVFLSVSEDKLPQKAKVLLAKQLVEVVWDNDQYRTRSRELWRPLSDAVLTSISENRNLSHLEFRDFALSKIDEFWKEEESDNRRTNRQVAWIPDDEKENCFPMSMNQQICSEWYLKMVQGEL